MRLFTELHVDRAYKYYLKILSQNSNIQTSLEKVTIRIRGGGGGGGACIVSYIWGNSRTHKMYSFLYVCLAALYILESLPILVSMCEVRSRRAHWG